MPKNFLILRADNIGDFITALPLAETLKKNGAGTVHYAGKAQHKAFVKNSPYIDSFLDSSRSTVEIEADIDRLNIDCIVNLVNVPEAKSTLSAAKKIPVRIGPASKLNFALRYSHPVWQRRSNSIKSEAEYNLDLLNVLPLEKNIAPVPRLFFDKKEISAVKTKLARLTGDKELNKDGAFIVMHCGMNGSALNMPFETYQDVLAGALFLGATVLLTGSGKAEKKTNQKLIEDSGNPRNSPCYNLSGKLNLRELCVALHLARVYVGPSTGPTHIAAAAGTNIVSFYPPVRVMSKTRWAPYGAIGAVLAPSVPCPQSYKCAGTSCPYYFCMSQITAQQIIHQIADLYRQGSDV